MGCLYRISFPTGKSYIGITAKTAAERFRGHCYDAKRGLRLSLCRAIREQGIAAAFVETLVIADDWAYLQDLERKAIMAFDTRAPHGLNNTDGGDGASPGSSWHKGHKHSVEQKEKWSVERKGRKHATETCAKIGAALKGNKRNSGHKASKETRAKMSAAHTGRTWTAEQRARFSAARKALFAAKAHQEKKGGGDGREAIARAG